ncbi:MAG: glycerophosphodiester phosphodiesterase [Myxococcota bacterium]
MLTCGAITACGDGARPASGGAAACETAAELLRCEGRTLNIAPRGGQRARPEHTLLAYDHAFEVGADGLELDVQSTRDGVLVMMFDDTVNRTTDGTGFVREMTFEELRNHDAAWSFTPDGGQTFPYRGTGVVVPTLEEVLARYPDAPLFIEARQGTPPIIEPLIAAVRSADATDRVVLTSFNQGRLAEVRQLAPEIATTMASAEVVEFFAVSNQGDPDPGYEPPAEFLLVPPILGAFELLHEGFVPTARLYDLRVHVFTINDRDEMVSLIEETGVDGILSDDPELLERVLEETGAAP